MAKQLLHLFILSMNACTKLSTMNDEPLNRAIALHRNDQLDGAELIYRDILSKSPNDPFVNNLLGVLMRQRGQTTEAARLLAFAINLKPDFADAHNNYALVLQDQRKIEQAIFHYNQCLKLNPKSGQAHSNLGSVFFECEKFEQALIHFENAIAIDPENAAAANNVGVIHFESGDVTKALEYFKKATEIAPNFSEALNNIGNALKSMGRFEDALAYYEKAVRADERFVLPKWNRALVLITQGRYAEGWQEYDWRLHTPEHFSRNFSIRPYRGEELTNRSLLIYAEQGVGDELFFAGFFAEALQRTEKVIVDCEPRLAPLFRRSFPGAIIHAGHKRDPIEWIHDHGPIDYQISAGSLPRYFRHTHELTRARESYLGTDSTLTKKCRETVKRLGPGLKIGISWKGGKTKQDRGERRSTLDEWESILMIPGVHFVNLQYGDCSDELTMIKKKLGVTIHQFDEIDALKDMDHFAALISSLDHVVTMANANAHLCGALGVATSVLVPLSPDYRWGAFGERSPWYPNVELCRQTRLGEWQIALRHAQNAITQKIRHRLPARR